MGAASSGSKARGVATAEEEFLKFSMVEVRCFLTRARNVVSRGLLACQRTSSRRHLHRTSIASSPSAGDEHVSLFHVTVTMSEYYELFGTCRDAKCP
jgi:hypothetical protein